jgi:hypothetical protein
MRITTTQLHGLSSYRSQTGSVKLMLLKSQEVVLSQPHPLKSPELSRGRRTPPRKLPALLVRFTSVIRLSSVDPEDVLIGAPLRYTVCTRFDNSITSIVIYTASILTICQDHLKKHAKEGDISRETLDAVKKLKPCIKDSSLEAKAAERWSLTYRYLHKLSSRDKIPSPCKLSTRDFVYRSISSAGSYRLSKAGDKLPEALAAFYIWI